MLDDETTEGPLTISASLNELGRMGVAPPSTRRFHTALRTLHQAAHGLDVSEDAAMEAAEVGTISWRSCALSGRGVCL